MGSQNLAFTLIVGAIWNITHRQKMARVAGGGPPQWLSTHPSSDMRIRDLQDYAGRVMPLYEAVRRR